MVTDFIQACHVGMVHADVLVSKHGMTLVNGNIGVGTAISGSVVFGCTISVPISWVTVYVLLNRPRIRGVCGI